MSVYGYGNFVGGIAYPKIKRTYEYAEPEKWAKAAIYNAAIVKENPWVNHLREKDVYDQIKKLLEAEKADYVPVNPVNRRKNLTRQLNRIRNIYEIVNKDYDSVRKEYTYKTPYEQAKAAALAKLIRQANMTAKELGVQVELSLPSVPIPNM